jgi:integrase
LTKKIAIEERFAGDNAAIEWLKAQQKVHTQLTYVQGWELFRAFTGLTGNQILADRENDKEGKWEKQTLAFKAWVLTQHKKTGRKETYSEAKAASATVAVRSFFSYYRKDLKFRTAEASKLAEARAKERDYRYTREDLTEIANVANLQGKYIVTAGKSFGMRIGDFLKLTRGDLEPYLNQTPPISIGELPTTKEGVKMCPFIDTDALPIIRLMLAQMDREGRIAPNEPILDIKELQVNNVLKSLTTQAGINLGNKRVRFHCLRKFLSDRLASHMAESKWKQIVGKEIDEGAYISPDLLRADYERAMADTTFTKAASQDVELIAAKKAMEMAASVMNIPEHIKRQIMREIKDVKTPDELEKIKKEIMENQTQPNGGGLAFQQVAEETLAKILLGALKKVKEAEA